MDTKLKNILIEKNINLVHLCANRFKGRGIEYDDIFQSGCIGLVKAFNAFDNNRGVKFSTYAVPVIFGEIKQLFRNTGSLKISRKIKDLSIKINRTCENFMTENGRNPSINEISEILGIEVQQIIESLESSKTPMSLTISDTENESFEENEISVNFEEEQILNKIEIKSVLEKLNSNDKNIIILRFFKYKTQSQTAKLLGTTQVQISRREKVLLETLKLKLSYKV